MSQNNNTQLGESAFSRWSILILASLVMMMGYIFGILSHLSPHY